MRREVSRTVPPFEHRFEGEALVLADRDEPPRIDERVDLDRLEVRIDPIVTDVAHEELVGRVMIELRPLMAAERVLDRELVELELRGELVHVDGIGLQ